MVTCINLGRCSSTAQEFWFISIPKTSANLVRVLDSALAWKAVDGVQVFAQRSELWGESLQPWVCTPIASVLILQSNHQNLSAKWKEHLKKTIESTSYATVKRACLVLPTTGTKSMRTPSSLWQNNLVCNCRTNIPCSGSEIPAFQMLCIP